MAARLPSIKLGGHGSTVLTPGNKGGFIAKDEDEFYKFFDMLHGDKQLREQMGNDGLEIIKQKYLIEHSAEITRTFYKELINAR
jgi:glycosyltransferase involved in cell wall biosynthesis